MEHATWLQDTSQGLREFWLYDTALMVLFLVPWVREKQLNRINAVIRNQLQHFNRIVFVSSQVCDTGFFRQVQQ